MKRLVRILALILAALVTWAAFIWIVCEILALIGRVVL